MLNFFRIRVAKFTMRNQNKKHSRPLISLTGIQSIFGRTIQQMKFGFIQTAIRTSNSRLHVIQIGSWCICKKVSWFFFLLFTVFWIEASAETEPVVEINGLEQPLQNNVRAHLSLSREKCDAPEWEIERLFAKSPQQIQTALRALGYYHPQIQKKLILQDDCWMAVFDIQAGDPVTLNEISLKLTGEGAEEAFFQPVLKDSGLETGNILDHSRYEDLKKRLATLAESKGYLDYRFDQQRLEVNTDRNLANIVIDFNTGPRYYIDQIEISQEILDPEFVARYLEIKKGQPYDRSQIIKSHQALDKSGYLNQIQIKYLEDDAVDYHAPVQVILQPNRRHVLSFGAGYDTDLGPRGSAEYVNRYVNRRGHRFDARLSVALRKSYLYMDYLVPLEKPLKNQFMLTAGLKYEDTDSVLSKTFLVGARFSQIVLEEMLLTQQLNFIGEDYNAGDGGRRFGLLLVPKFTLSNISANKKGMYVDGYKYSMQLQGASRSVLSDVSFIQAFADFKVSQSFSWGGRVLARAEGGATAVDDFFDLPTSFRFYAGGTNSIRAFKYKSLGPENQQGEVIGGKYLAVASLEYEQKVIDQWSLAVFADAGNAFNDDFDIKAGFGWGIRWYSLVGPIRADMAFPTEDPGDFRFNFSFSTAL